MTTPLIERRTKTAFIRICGGEVHYRKYDHGIGIQLHGGSGTDWAALRKAGNDFLKEHESAILEALARPAA